MQNVPVLLPQPREIIFSGASHALSDLRFITVDETFNERLEYSATRIQSSFKTYLNLMMEITTTARVDENVSKLALRIDAKSSLPAQGYQLSITPGDISITAKDESGLFYGICTLVQIISWISFHGTITTESNAGVLPCLEIVDWPDFACRGVMLDISRDKVPTMDTIFSLVDLLASWKINQLQLYTEHTFAYQQQPEIWANASPFTAAEIQELDKFCKDRYVELVPNQNSFGHMERWLKYPRYNPLAEIPDSYNYQWGRREGPACLCPTDERSIALVSSLYDELLPNFTSRQVNVGCDETFDVGKGRSKDACLKYGTGQIYLDYLNKIYHEVTRRGYSMQFWADMVLANKELMHLIPEDAIGLIWGYEADYPFEQHARQFANAGLKYYVCPGTSSWNSITGRTQNCLENLKSAAKNGREYGAIGYLNTDWGDNGHWQVLPVSYLGLAAGAAYSWAYHANETIDIQEALNRYAFIDTAGKMGQVAFNLGNLYREAGNEPENTSILFEILQEPICKWTPLMARSSHHMPAMVPIQRSDADLDLSVKVYEQIQDLIDQSAADLKQSESARCDKELLVNEFQLAMHLLDHACTRAIFASLPSSNQKTVLAADLEHIVEEYQAIWLARNRPGGLSDSLSFFETARGEYQTHTNYE